MLLATVAVLAQTGSGIIGIDSFATKLQRRPQPRILDVRTKEEYAINHVTNAVNVDVSQPGYEEQLKALPKTEPVFIYAINNARTTKLAKQLLAGGFNEVYELQGGIANWIGSGYPYFSSVANKTSVSEFDKQIDEKIPVLVDFYSRYCGLCKKARPVVDSFQNVYAGKLKVVAIDINDNPGLIARLGVVHAVPTFVLYNNEKLLWQKTGIDTLQEDLRQALVKVNAAK